MEPWPAVRIAVILLAGVAAMLGPLGPQAAPPIGWGALAAIFVFTPLAILLFLSIQAGTARSGLLWRRPSWKLNPFNFRDPLQFLQLSVHVCLVHGFLALTRIAVSPVSFYVEALVPLVVAGGMLVGLQVAMLLFGSKLHHGT
jgi:hypothetical protein